MKKGEYDIEVDSDDDESTIVAQVEEDDSIPGFTLVLLMLSVL